MNFVFHDDQNLNNQYLQQILDIQNIYGSILSQNVQPNLCSLQSLLLQQLIQLQHNQQQQGQFVGYPDCYNSGNTVSTSSASSSPIPYLNTDVPPEYPLFPLFPRQYNAQYDQLKQLQDPKSKYNLGSKKDKDKGGNLNNSNQAPIFCVAATEEQQQQQQQQILLQQQQQHQLQLQYQLNPSQITKDLQRNTKSVGFQRVAKKSPLQSEYQGTVAQPTQQSAGIAQQRQDIINSFLKSEEEVIRQKQELNADSASTSGTKSPVISMLTLAKHCDQETHSQLETVCEPFSSLPASCLNSSKKENSEEFSSSFSSTTVTNAAAAVTTTQTAPEWSSILKEWNFKMLQSITDKSVLEEMASYIFKNPQLNPHQHFSSSSSSSQFNSLLDQFSQGRENAKLTNSCSNSSTSSNLNPSSSSSSASSTSSSSYLLGCFDRNMLSKENCNPETRCAITGDEPSEQNHQKRKEDTELVVSNIQKYLDSLNLKINFKQQENYALIFNKKLVETENQKQGANESSSSGQSIRENRSQTSPALREAFDSELLAASSFSNQFATCAVSLLEQEDAIIEENLIDLQNQGSSSDGTDEEVLQADNENEEMMSLDSVKVKKRRGFLSNATLETKLQDQQSGSPVKKQFTEQSNTSQIKENGNSSCGSSCKIGTKSGKNGCDHSNGNGCVSSVQDTFMNARRNKKRDQKIQQTIEQNSQLSTKFHNLTRLLMYKIIQIFKDEQNLRETYNISPELSSHLKRIAGRIKQHSRDTCKSSIKTNFYTHSHYNALFLTLNEENIKTLATNQKEVDAHKFIFGVDLTNASAIHLTFANIVKNVAYEIVKKNLEASIMKEQLQNQQLSGSGASGYDKEQMQNHISNLRSQYFQRAFQGITKMNNGQIVSRF